MDLDVVPCCGKGTIVSCRIALDGWCEPGRMHVPVIAIVELDEGPWLYTVIDHGLNTVPHNLSRVAFQFAEPGERFPHFSLT